MRKLKLFPKTFLYTIGIMTVIVILVHGLMYLLLPSFYTDLKREEVNTRATELIGMLQDANEMDILPIAEKYALQYNVNITLLMNDREYQFQGFTPLGIYFDPTITEGKTTDYILNGPGGMRRSHTKLFLVQRHLKVKTIIL